MTYMENDIISNDLLEEKTFNSLFDESREYNEGQTQFFDEVVRTLSLCDTDPDFDWTLAL